MNESGIKNHNYNYNNNYRIKIQDTDGTEMVIISYTKIDDTDNAGKQPVEYMVYLQKHEIDETVYDRLNRFYTSHCHSSKDPEGFVDVTPSDTLYNILHAIVGE